MCMHPCSPPLFQNYRMKHQAIDIAFFYSIHPLSLIQYRGHSGDGAYPSTLDRSPVYCRVIETQTFMLTFVPKFNFKTHQLI